MYVECRGVGSDASRVVPARGGAAAVRRAAGGELRGRGARVGGAARRRRQRTPPRLAAAPAPQRARKALHTRHDTPHHTGTAHFNNRLFDMLFQKLNEPKITGMLVLLHP